MDLHGSIAAVSVEVKGEIFKALIRSWVLKSSNAVSHYYGKFPVPRVAIEIHAIEGQKVGGGVTFPGEIPRITIRVGRNATESELLHSDWTMVHEKIHLAFPWMANKHNWMTEGLAVYIDSISRVQVGHLSEERIWSDFTKMMPRGLPQATDGGFEISASWGRTYWGGAMFCLLADVRIRVETDNKWGLQHALRAINSKRDFRQEWDFLETLTIGDAATGRNVLVSLYEEMKSEAVSPDLEALWRNLGIVKSSSGISFDDAAPLANIRKAIITV